MKHRVRKEVDLLGAHLPMFCDSLNTAEAWLRADEMKGIEAKGIEADEWRTAIEIVDLLRGGPDHGKRQAEGRPGWKEAAPQAAHLFNSRYEGRAHAYLLVQHGQFGRMRPLRLQGVLRDEFPPTRRTRQGHPEKGSVVALELWQWVFNRQGYERIRRCRRETCRRFFVAWGRTQRRKHCNNSCKNKRWNRTERQRSKEKRR